MGCKNSRCLPEIFASESFVIHWDYSLGGENPGEARIGYLYGGDQNELVLLLRPLGEVLAPK